MKNFISLFFIFSIKYLAAQVPTISLGTEVISGLNNPLQAIHAGDNSHKIYVVEQTGTIKVFNADYTPAINSQTANNIFFEISLSNNGGEQGLLSAAFHPNYANNGYFYIYYTNNSGNLQVDRITRSATIPNRADFATRIQIITIPHPETNHNGGEMHFGRDGYLYISTGDGGGGGDPYENGQDNTKLLGKLLRINVDATENMLNYAIPADNPFAGQTLGKEIYCSGLRNPFRWEFDRITGDCYIGDVGQDKREEVSYRPADLLRATNFGWDCYEGTELYEASGCVLTGPTPYTPPIYEYVTGDGGNSIIGGGVYRGYQYPSLQGYYLCADYYRSNLWLLKKNGTQWPVNQQNIGFSSISDFSETEDGEMLIVRRNGNIYQVKTNQTPKMVYTFSGNGDWASPANWKGNNLPPATIPADAFIVIKPIKGGKCTLNQTVTITGAKNLIVEPGAVFEVNNNLVFGE